MKYIILLLTIFCLACEQPKTEYRKKVVNHKEVIKNGDYMLSFKDGDDANVTFGMYHAINIGDTLIFRCEPGLSFSRWSSTFVEIIKPLNQ